VERRCTERCKHTLGSVGLFKADRIVKGETNKMRDKQKEERYIYMWNIPFVRKRGSLYGRLTEEKIVREREVKIIKKKSRQREGVEKRRDWPTTIPGTAKSVKRRGSPGSGSRSEDLVLLGWRKDWVWLALLPLI